MTRIPVAPLFAAWLLSACGSSETPTTPPAAVYGAAPASAPAAAPEAAAEPASTTPSAAVGSQTLDYPDDLQLLLLAYCLAGQTPPFDTWARTASSVHSADEFSRAAALKTEIERLQAVAASVADAGFLRVKTDCNLSEYDGSRGGYYLPAFEPGVRYNFEAFREKLGLQVANSADAYLWPLTPDAAREVLQKAGMRTVSVDMRIAVSRATRRSSGSGSSRTWNSCSLPLSESSSSAHPISSGTDRSSTSSWWCSESSRAVASTLRTTRNLGATGMTTSPSAISGRLSVMPNRKRSADTAPLIVAGPTARSC